MERVTAVIGNNLYKTVVKTTIHSIIADEPEHLGGKDSGFSPPELLAASLASCTSITLRMYANRKKWNVEEIEVTVTFERDAQANTAILDRKIQIIGSSKKQRDCGCWLLPMPARCIKHSTEQLILKPK
ncbi:MAG: OsmC family protein [Flavobacteriaceae bacterium]|jgi:putative redox protein|nr:OsmC family protein [Flavobacteriaceae bacterium]